MFWQKRVYLDFAAGATANASSPHEEGRLAKQKLEAARLSIARLIEVQADDVIFTSGATEANALAILGTVRSRQKAVGSHEKIHVLYLPSAHASIVENMKMLEGEGVVVEPLPIKNFQVDCEALAKMIRPKTVLVSMDAVCGETGVVWNTREVASVLRSKEVRPPLKRSDLFTLLHVDASQAPLTEKITRAHFNADLLTFDASKVGAVRGIGALIAHRTIPLVPLYVGGGQERGLRPGSEPYALAEEFAAALAAAALGREAFRAASEQLRAQLTSSILKTIPNVFINESPKNQAPHIFNLSLPAGRQGLPGRDTDYLVALLDEAGFAVSTRSACETDSEEGSRAVFALFGDPERAKATLRISWGPAVRAADLERFASALERAVVFVDRTSQR